MIDRANRNGSSCREDLLRCYEEVRRQGIEEDGRVGGGLGLSLFIRKGMAAWIAAWSECVYAAEPSTRKECTSPPTLSSLVRHEATVVLAGMALGVLWGEELVA